MAQQNLGTGLGLGLGLGFAKLTSLFRRDILVVTDFLLLEDDCFLLQEDDVSRILL